MVSALALFTERLKREREYGAIRAAILDQYEVTKDAAERLPRTTVYASVASAVGSRPDTNRFRRSVITVACELGVSLMAPANRRVFACVRPRSRPAPEWTPPTKLSDRELGQLRRRWYARAQSGDGAIEDIERANGDLKKGVSQRALDQAGWWQTRSAINAAYFAQRSRAYWDLRASLDIWALYVVECLTIRQIAERTGATRWRVHTTLQAFERWMTAGRPGLAEETSNDQNEMDDGRDI